MQRYNKIMLYFWLCVGVFLLISVTYMGATEGFDKWAYYYIFPGLAILMFFMRRWMMARMERHVAFLEEQEKQRQAENQ